MLTCLDKNGKGLDVSEKELRSFFEFSAVASGLTATKVGVFSSMPTLSEVEAAMPTYLQQIEGF